jgi:hypothetical protein
MVRKDAREGVQCFGGFRNPPCCNRLNEISRVAFLCQQVLAGLESCPTKERISSSVGRHSYASKYWQDWNPALQKREFRHP